MSTVTWDEGGGPPSYARGLPSEIHFWKSGGELWLLRDTDDPSIPHMWCMWHKGVAIKDVGIGFVAAVGCGKEVTRG